MLGLLIVNSITAAVFYLLGKYAHTNKEAELVTEYKKKLSKKRSLSGIHSLKPITELGKSDKDKAVEEEMSKLLTSMGVKHAKED